MQIVVDVNREQVDALNAIAQRSGKAQAEVVCEAISEYAARHQPSIRQFYGIWADNTETQDVQGYLDRIRAEWDR